MSTEAPKLSRSRQLAAKVLYAALRILKEKGGQAPGREVAADIEKTIELDDWAREIYKKSGYVRWQSILHFFTIDAIKAGYLIKKKGVWYITPEGEEALKLGERGLFEAASAAYRKWSKANQPADEDEVDEAIDAEKSGEKNQEATVDEMEQRAIEGLKSQVAAKNPYEFQDLIAALLRGMGYYTPFVAPKGKDGGLDVIAYKDPLGTISPRVKVQAKHRTGPASVQELRQLLGVLQKDGDVGMFVSSGGFTTDAKAAARVSSTHIELIDFERLMALWQEFYPKMTDEDKGLLPLVPIWFYNPPA